MGGGDGGWRGGWGVSGVYLQYKRVSVCLGTGFAVVCCGCGSYFSTYIY